MAKKRGIYFTGVSGLESKLKKNATMNDVKDVIKMNTVELQKEAMRRAKFEGHFDGDVWMSPTGFTKRSIEFWLNQDGMSSKTGPQSEYAAYLEYGTRFMDAQPFMRPAFRKIKKQFQKDIKRLVD